MRPARNQITSQQSNRGEPPLLITDETTLPTEMSPILKRWDEHFRSVLSRPSTIFAAANDQLVQRRLSSLIPPIHSPPTPMKSSVAFTTAAVTTSNTDPIPTCPHSDRTFNSRIDLVDHSRVHRAVTTSTKSPFTSAATADSFTIPTDSPARIAIALSQSVNPGGSSRKKPERLPFDSASDADSSSQSGIILETIKPYCSGRRPQAA
ncbi:hypothetical protein SprV_0501906700 [Sparganum proliferum]